MKDELINTFLHFGYLPNKEYEFPFDPELISEKRMDSYSEDELIEKGSNILKNIFEKKISEFDSERTHIVPLSAGLDSRAILGGLLDQGLKDEIITVTFGTSGSWDYDIPPIIAKKTKVKHVSIELNDINLSTKKLLNTIQNNTNSKYHFLIDLFYNKLIYKEFGKKPIYWSGFMAGELAGSHLKNQIKSFAEVKKRFVSQNKKVSFPISHPDFNPLNILPDKPFCKQSQLSFMDQLDFGIRQTKYIKPITVQKEYDCEKPFLNDKWIKFILSVPNKFRQNKKIYKKILLKSWPKLFNMPTESNFGLPLNAPRCQIYPRILYSAALTRAKRFFPKIKWPPNPGINYLDFDQAIRERKDYNKLVKTNLQDLKNRNVIDWLDIDSLWNQHINRKENLGRVLLLLTVLEINLKFESF